MLIARTHDSVTTPRPDAVWASYKGRIVRAANKVGAEMDGCGIEALRLLAAAHDIVFAAWQDRNEPDGVGTMLIKGQQAMREVIADGESRAMALTAIPCRHELEAQALRDVIGEADGRH